MKSTHSRASLAVAVLVAAVFAGAVPAQIKGLDGNWSFFTGLGEGSGNVKQMTGSGKPKAGKSVTVNTWVVVQEEWPGKDSSVRRPMWATKVIDVGPNGRRLMIDNRLSGQLKVEDTGGEARVAAHVSIHEFNPQYGPLAGKKYPPQKKGPASIRLAAVGTYNVDKKRNDWVWLEPGSYVIEVFMVASAKMTTGVGGDRSIAQFTPGTSTYGFTATFADGGATVPRTALLDRSGLGIEMGQHADASGIIGGATGAAFFPTGLARGVDGSFILAGSNPFSSGHMSVAVVDANGKFVSRTTAPATWTPTTDIARDPLRGFVYVVLADRRVHCFDPATGLFLASRSVPVASGLGLGTIKALAFDPVGDLTRSKAGKVGSFWISDGVKAVEIAERDGALLRRPVLPSGLQVSGAAFHPGTRQVWWLGQKGSQHVAVLTDAASAAPSGLEVVVGPRAVTNGGEITLREANGNIEQELTFITTDAGGKRVYRRVNTTFVYAVSDGGRIGLAGRPTPGGTFRVTLDRSEGSQALLMFHVEAVAPLALPPVLGVDSVLALPFSALLLPPVAITGGRATHAFPVPNQRIFQGARGAWQWLVVTPQVPLQTSDAGVHRIL